MIADYKIMKKYLEESDQAGDFFDSAGLSEMLPELSKAIEIFRSIPATSCSSERSFSALGRIRMYLRNQTGLFVSS